MDRLLWESLQFNPVCVLGVLGFAGDVGNLHEGVKSHFCYLVYANKVGSKSRLWDKADYAHRLTPMQSAVPTGGPWRAEAFGRDWNKKGG